MQYFGRLCRHVGNSESTLAQSFLYIMSNIYRQEKWDYFRYYLAYGYSGIYWAGLEIEIDFSAVIE